MIDLAAESLEKNFHQKDFHHQNFIAKKFFEFKTEKKLRQASGAKIFSLEEKFWAVKLILNVENGFEARKSVHFTNSTHMEFVSRRYAVFSIPPKNRGRFESSFYIFHVHGICKTGKKISSAVFDRGLFFSLQSFVFVCGAAPA